MNAAQRYPYLAQHGSLSDEAAAARFLRRYMRGRELRQTPEVPRAPWIGGSSGVYTLHPVQGPGTEANPVRVAARFRLAAAVVLVVEEYLRWLKDPPEELLACAALCWMDDLVRAVDGCPLRSSGDRR